MGRRSEGSAGGRSSAGRASASQAEGRGFETRRPLSQEPAGNRHVSISRAVLAGAPVERRVNAWVNTLQKLVGTGARRARHPEMPATDQPFQRRVELLVVVQAVAGSSPVAHLKPETRLPSGFPCCRGAGGEDGSMPQADQAWDWGVELRDEERCELELLRTTGAQSRTPQRPAGRRQRGLGNRRTGARRRRAPHHRVPQHAGRDAIIAYRGFGSPAAATSIASPTPSSAPAASVSLQRLAP
jgi:hypothetical protein